jgi:hypothetical protein
METKNPHNSHTQDLKLELFMHGPGLHPENSEEEEEEEEEKPNPQNLFSIIFAIKLCLLKRQ